MSEPKKGLSNGIKKCCSLVIEFLRGERSHLPFLALPSCVLLTKKNTEGLSLPKSGARTAGKGETRVIKIQSPNQAREPVVGRRLRMRMSFDTRLGVNPKSSSSCYYGIAKWSFVGVR